MAKTAPPRSRIVLSPEAESLLQRGFSLGWPAYKIARALAEIGVTVSERTVARRREHAWLLQQRDEVLAQLAELPKSTWSVDEVVRLLEDVDVRDGWDLRGRRRLHHALMRFLKNPSESQIRQLTELCASYALSFKLLGRRPKLVTRQRGEARNAR